MRTDFAWVLHLADMSRDPDPAALNAWSVGWGLEQWAGALELLDQQRLTGTAAWRLRKAGADLPQAVAQDLTRRLHRNKFRALGSLKAFDGIRKALQAEGIAVIPFKGIDLVRHLYPDPGMRTFEDMDLMIRFSEVDRAGEVMKGLGYEAPGALLPACLVKRFHFHLPFVDRKGGHFVELHWLLADRRTLDPTAAAGLWNAETVPERLPPLLYTAYLAAHIAKHGYMNRRILNERDARSLLLHPWSEMRLSWFVDLQLMMERHGLSRDEVVTEAEKLKCAAAVKTTLALLECLQQREAVRGDPAAGPSRLYDRYLKQMRFEIEQGGGLSTELPRAVRVNKLTHIRPIRLLDLFGKSR